ncbi:MAG TPA: hypothetical protein VML75_07610 [Kofleriaceae bacterium]|nr:hypothetical protein [Kofleriaceae bacterium]
MDRQPPRSSSDEIDLYVRTYYSLLRSSGDVKVRAFEEAHAFSDSSLHAHARAAAPDLAAFGYSAARLPMCMPEARVIVMGQSNEQFRAAGFDVADWERVTTRGRRRPLRWSGDGVIAAFVTSTTDIDDLVPIVTAYQIEWNKMHAMVAGHRLTSDTSDEVFMAELGVALDDVAVLRSAFGAGFDYGVSALTRSACDISMRLLDGSFLEYQRAAKRWWRGVEPVYGNDAGRPVYFVSSNTHALSNLLGGYAVAHREDIVRYVRERNPEELAPVFDAAIAAGDDGTVSNLSYYLLRQYLHADRDRRDARVREVQDWDAASGITTIETPGHIDVSAQVIELCKLAPERFDPRLGARDRDALAASKAVIVNIDYPLGMAAYHHLSCVAQGVGDIRGVYVMGKAATLNARVGDVMISTVAYDEHSSNTYLFRNCFAADDVQRVVSSATVLDNQKALTVRGSFLQNREYMGVFYREGYTVLEMEAGPYLSAVYEMVYPNRHPRDEIVHLSNIVPFELGILHYASDTPYSRRQSLLSKSLSYFGVDSTYGCAIAIARRILDTELGRG